MPLAACLVLAVSALWAAGPRNPQTARAAAGAKPKHVSRITPQIPKANRNQPGKVFLEVPLPMDQEII